MIFDHHFCQKNRHVQECIYFDRRALHPIFQYCLAVHVNMRSFLFNIEKTYTHDLHLQLNITYRLFITLIYLLTHINILQNFDKLVHIGNLQDRSTCSFIHLGNPSD